MECIEKLQSQSADRKLIAARSPARSRTMGGFLQLLDIREDT